MMRASFNRAPFHPGSIAALYRNPDVLRTGFPAAEDRPAIEGWPELVDREVAISLIMALIESFKANPFATRLALRMKHGEGK
jgi:hypothetical protein